MTRYKLVRIVGGKFLSANAIEFKPTKPYCLEYKLGQETSAKELGIACYKALKFAQTPHNIKETMHSFNEGNSIAILEVEPIGKAKPMADMRYGKGLCYEGGINYPAVRTIRVVKEIEV